MTTDGQRGQTYGPFPGRPRQGERRVDDLEPLLNHPRNETTPRVFIAATHQHGGKTTTSLGLFSALRARFDRVGYIKPVGQRFIDVGGLKIDEDSVLLDSIFDVDAPIEAMSPIAIDGTFTRRYLDDPGEIHEVLVDKLCRAFDRTAYQKDAIIVEGSGHAGVGSVFDLSNADVARILRAPAIIVAEGGIGRPVDEIALNKAVFDRCGVPVVGAVLNKVLPEKIDEVCDYTGRALERLGVPLLGVIPVARALSAPSLGQIVDSIRGNWISGRDLGRGVRILRVVADGVTTIAAIEGQEAGVLVVTPGDRREVLEAVLAGADQDGERVVRGLVLTRGKQPGEDLLEAFREKAVPVVLSKRDSYWVASRINAMTIKTRPEDVDKITLIRQLVTRHVDIERILSHISP